MAESVLAVVAVVMMVVAILLSILPVFPGAVVVWAIGMVYAALTHFAQVTWLSAALMTALMLVGATAGWWMHALGMKTQGSSCTSILGAAVGGLIGSFVIPLPILGTLIGAVVGAMLFEFAHVGELREALRAGGTTIVGYVLSVIAEMVFGSLILLVFVVSLLLAG